MVTQLNGLPLLLQVHGHVFLRVTPVLLVKGTGGGGGEGRGGTLSVLVCDFGSSCVGGITPDSATCKGMYVAVAVEESHDLVSPV